MTGQAELVPKLNFGSGPNIKPQVEMKAFMQGISYSFGFNERIHSILQYHRHYEIIYK